MKNKNEVIMLFSTLNKLTNIGNAKFKYGIIKNLKLINSEIETLSKIEQENNNIIKDFESKKAEIINKYGIKDGDNIIIKNDSENFNVALLELEKLKEEYKDSLEEYNIKLKEYNELLNEDCKFEFSLYKINPNDLPDDISSENLGVLMLLEIVD